MYVLWNAMKNLGRNKGRNILMAVIIFAIIFVTVISIMINTATTSIIEDYKKRFGSEAYIKEDYQMMQELYDEGIDPERPSAKQKLDYRNSDLLQGSFYYSSMDIMLRDLHGYDEDGNPPPRFIEGGNTDIFLDGNASINATSNITKFFMFKEHKIVEGRMFENLDECIISDDLAELNNLSVGDTIKFDSIIKSRPMTHQLTISGIYHDSRTPIEKGQRYKVAVLNEANAIFISIETVANMEMVDQTVLMSIFYLKDRTLLADFESELREKGLPDYMKLVTDEDGYKRIVGPVEDLTKTSTTFLVAVFVLGSLIILILSALAIRERKYEIGVLLAMGMKKGKMAVGLLCESIVITGVCLLLGLGLSTMAAQPVADYLLEDQIEFSQDSQDIPLYTGPVIEDAYVLEAHLDQIALSQIAVVTLVITLASSLVGILYITRYQPMRILSERD